MAKRLVLGALWTCIVFGVIVLAYYMLFDRGGQPYCHKGIDMALHNWRDANKLDKTTFPNIDGSSAKSLAEIREFFGVWEKLEETYMYVPGLRTDDPGDLVLMYLPQPTRWTWHGGPPPNVFKPKGWILVPVDMKFYGNRNRDELGPGEFSEWVSFMEFKDRLQKTLDFLRDNERPNWEAVVEEHTRFLGRAETW